jgi:hypothetical protein
VEGDYGGEEVKKVLDESQVKQIIGQHYEDAGWIVLNINLEVAKADYSIEAEVEIVEDEA